MAASHAAQALVVVLLACAFVSSQQARQQARLEVDAFQREPDLGIAVRAVGVHIAADAPREQDGLLGDGCDPATHILRRSESPSVSSKWCKALRGSLKIFGKAAPWPGALCLQSLITALWSDLCSSIALGHSKLKL